MIRLLACWLCAGWLYASWLYLIAKRHPLTLEPLKGE